MIVPKQFFTALEGSISEPIIDRESNGKRKLKKEN